MTIQERVQELFNKFNVNLKVEATRTELAEATLENGTVIYTDGDDFVEDGEAYIINDEGERIPLPLATTPSQTAGLSPLETSAKSTKSRSPCRMARVAKAREQTASLATCRTSTPQSRRRSRQRIPPPADPPPKKKKKLSSHEEQTTDMKVELNAEQVLSMLVERFPDLGEEVAQAIANAVAEIYAEPEVEAEKDEDEEMGYKDKEEMDVDPEAKKEETPVAEVEVEVEVEEEEEEEEEKEELSAQRSEIDKLKEALEETNARLEQLQKLSAHSGLKHKAPSFKKAEPLDLTNMTTEERVRALANQFNS